MWARAYCFILVPLTWTKRQRSAVWGNQCFFLCKRVTGRLLLLGLCHFLWQMLLGTNAKMWHKSHYSLNCQTKYTVWQSWSEQEAESKAGNETEAYVYLSQLNGKGISVHESDPAQCFAVHTCAHIDSCCVSGVWFTVSLAQSAFPWCSYSQGLQLLDIVGGPLFSLPLSCGGMCLCLWGIFLHPAAANCFYICSDMNSI